MRFLRTIGLACTLILSAPLWAGPSSEMAAAAKNLLAALDDGQRSKAVFAWNVEERENWAFIPKERKGLTLGEMNSAQKQLAQALLSTGLSHRGYVKANTIISLEQILQELEGPGRRFPRDPGLYHVSIFGEPSEQGTWGWRFEGHHLSLNFTLVDGQVAASTPSFMGTNPAEVRKGPRAGLRVLAQEEDLARELVKSLSDAQKKVAIVETNAPDDILTAATRVAVMKQTNGIPFSKLTRAQRAIGERLLREYVERVRPEVAAQDLAKIRKAGMGKIRFAWAGGLEKGQRHYYRLHGPTFVMEYDNTQNDANHIHAVWRDFENDFGRDVLAEHLKHDHSGGHKH